MSHDGPVLLFDGVCNLCSDAVQFVIKRDRKGRFRFASLQSEEGRTRLKGIGLELDPTDPTDWSMVLIIGGRAHVRSGAALRIAARLDRGWPLAAVFLVIPWPVRDIVYRLVARNRYRWFGQKDVCYIPEQDESWRFLDAAEPRESTPS